MKNVRITTTFEAINYGAVLQAFALQQVVSQMCPDADVKVVNYRPQFTRKDLKIVRTEIGSGIKKVLHAAVDLATYKIRKNRLNSFQKFRDQYLKLTEPYSESQLLRKEMPVDCAISGSDQIWNPNITDGVPNPVYFLQFAPQNCKKIAYASSMGEYKLTEPHRQTVLDYLNTFDSLSVREATSADILEKAMGREVETVLDPTLLLTADEWSEYLKIDRTAATEKYVFVMSAANRSATKKLIQLARAVAKQQQAKLVIIGSELPVAGATVLRDASPQKVVELIANAAVVVTNSFHGTVFAVNFGKNLISANDFIRPGRKVDFLKQIGLYANYKENLESPVSEKDWTPDYETAQPKLLQLRQASMDYLRQALSDFR